MKTLKEYTFILLAALLSSLGMASCSDEPEPAPDELTHRTLIIYMAADNSLLSASRDNLNDIKTAVSNGALQGGRIILFYDYSATEAPYLAEITEETGDFVKLKEYDAQVSSLDRDRMKEVIGDAIKAAPAEEYGLILWSHGTGWMNESDSRNSASSSNTSTYDGLVNPYSFGHDIHPVSTKMSITSLASALEDFHFKFIYFDCCFMATIETIYELRNTADYIIGSPTELPVEGMPYLTNIPEMMSKQIRPETIAKNTLDYYLSGKASYPWCTITAIDTSAADDIAEATKAIMETGALNSTNYVPLPYYRSSVPSYTWDFAHIINNLDVDDDVKSYWNMTWEKLIIYYGHTDICYFVPMDGTAGLGSFYYSDSTAQWAKQYGYDTLSWWRDVVSFNPSINL